MPRRRNVKIIKGRYKGRTGSIVRFDYPLIYVKVDGGRDSGNVKSDGTARHGDGLWVWMKEWDAVRTGDTARSNTPPEPHHTA